jgi:hypothetical protein
MSAEIQTYAALRTMIRKALREQHPEWVDARGECALCKVYEVRFAHLLGVFASAENAGKVPLFETSGGDDASPWETVFSSASSSRSEMQPSRMKDINTTGQWK